MEITSEIIHRTASPSRFTSTSKAKLSYLVSSTPMALRSNLKDCGSLQQQNDHGFANVTSGRGGV